MLPSSAPIPLSPLGLIRGPFLCTGSVVRRWIPGQARDVTVGETRRSSGVRYFPPSSASITRGDELADVAAELVGSPSRSARR